jgi:spore coat protein CotH
MSGQPTPQPAGAGGLPNAAGSSNSSPSGAGMAGVAGTTVVVPDTSGELYDPEKLPRFDLELPSESIAALQQDPDTYVRGSLRYGDEQVADIGIRIKGEGSLRTLNEKAAFKIKFDEFVSKQAFHGLRRMTLNNMVEDPSFLAERLAYHFYRFLDLPAPRCNSALVYVNGDFFGVYANVETEDKTFLRRWFESDDGNLYEEGQVDFEPGNEAKFDLETNETANDRSDLVALIAALSTARPASFLEDLDAELDTTHYLAFTAAEAAVNQWDMYGYTVFYPNNFRLYRDPTRSQFVFLPWGMDMSMKPFRDSGKPHIGIFDLARRGDFENGPVTAGLIFRRCLESPSCKSAYANVVGSTATRYEEAGLLALAEKYYEQVKDQVSLDPRREYSLSQFQAGYQSLKATISGRPAAMRASLME